MKMRVCDYCDTVILDNNYDTISIEGNFQFKKGNQTKINRDGDTHFCNVEHMNCWLYDRIAGKK
jgi:hypothetical protein